MLIIIALFILFIIGLFWSLRNWNDTLLAICIAGMLITLPLAITWIGTFAECHFGESTYTPAIVEEVE